MDPTGEELLPVKTKVRVSYKGTSVEKQQDVSNSPDFVFQTKLVTAELKDSSGNPISSGVTFHYRYGYGRHQTMDPTGEELLPVKTKVRVSYKGTSVEKQQDVSKNASFAFQTGRVEGTATQFRYGYASWQTFTNGIELLPETTKFKYANGNEIHYTVVAGQTNQIP
jgi:hypothetical protein